MCGITKDVRNIDRVTQFDLFINKLTDTVTRAVQIFDDVTKYC